MLPDLDVLSRLKEPDFDITQRAIVSREMLSNEQLTALQSLQSPSQPESAAASITLYRPLLVRISANTSSPALLMLNDSNYPGWQATVNGKPAPMLSTDYLFRGVMIPAGKSVVEFSYRPISFKLGAIVSVLTLLALIIVVARERIGRRRAETIPAVETGGFECHEHR